MAGGRGRPVDGERDNNPVDGERGGESRGSDKKGAEAEIARPHQRVIGQEPSLPHVGVVVLEVKFFFFCEMYRRHFFVL